MKRIDFNFKTHGESVSGGAEYLSPDVQVVFVQPEGVLCSSVSGIEHEDFSESGSDDL